MPGERCENAIDSPSAGNLIGFVIGIFPIPKKPPNPAPASPRLVSEYPTSKPMKTKNHHLSLRLFATSLLLGGAVWAAQPVTITNPGFENPVLTDGSFQAGAPGWSAFNSATINVLNPSSAADLTAEAPEGANVGLVTSSAVEDGLSQVLSSPFYADATYVPRPRSRIPNSPPASPVTAFNSSPTAPSSPRMIIPKSSPRTPSSLRQSTTPTTPERTPVWSASRSRSAFSAKVSWPSRNWPSTTSS